MSHGKQFTLYTHKGGPNGWKVAIVLEELGLTYESIYLDFQKGEQKAPEHIKHNPNGRIPTLIDHKNNDFTLWESGAIITYIVDKYDREHKISASNESDKFRQLQWLFFQASGQGPYFGQLFWFSKYHPEKYPSAIDRYRNEILRVFGVFESVLSKDEWLVGGKPSVADLSMIVWNRGAIDLLTSEHQPFDLEKDFPKLAAWHAKLEARDSVVRLYAVKAKLQ